MTKTDQIGLGSSGYPRPDVPRLSVAERDRRWARIRALMRRDGLDAVIALNHSGSWDQGNGNVRYLSSLGGNGAWVSVVFPLDGEVTAVTGPAPTADFWHQYQDWVHDIRPAFFNSTPMIVERLRELGLDRARIGVAGLAGVAREPDGLVSAGAYRVLTSELPDAEFVNATDLMYEARVVKSEEEIAFLRRAVELVEGAMDVMAREAGPGVPESVVYARMAAAMVERGSEPNSLLLWAAGNPLPAAVGPLPSRRPLAPDDVVLVEADARWGGYLGHVTTTHWVGAPDDTDRAMAEVQYEATRRCWEAFRPGTTLGEFVDICADAAAGSGFECGPIMHSRGTGMDAPVLVLRPRDERSGGLAVEENWVFVIKPRVSTPDGSRKMMWGDTVVATPEGAQRLGTRPAPAVELRR